ncbi:hypothetical protein ONR57_08890 [Hoyosella sp. YIM 151337]|uniref:hypothetical protein n=1 Tax=Hoyosella sp. YIM 151337 TaxID=2992742 RepID=UPI0022357107|nr:hypothetical protein [Hoyosella sp. YIM 151337]MCW4353411.1 hypothetical protein [Hoyosella sp. YIM 151337]
MGPVVGDRTLYSRAVAGTLALLTALLVGAGPAAPGADAQMLPGMPSVPLGAAESAVCGTLDLFSAVDREVCRDFAASVRDAVPSPVDRLSEGAGAALDATLDRMTEGALGSAAASAWSTAERAMKMMLTWWISIDTPVLYETDASGEPLRNESGDLVMSSLLSLVNDHTIRLQIWLAFISLSIVCLRAAVSWNTHRPDDAQNALSAVLRMAMVATLFSGLVVVGTAASDSIADWIVQGVLDQQIVDERLALMFMGSLPTFGDQGAFGMIIVGALLLISGFVNALFILVRNAMLILAVAAWPIAASASATERGNVAFQRITGFIVALLLFKPVAALVYLIAFSAVEYGLDDAGMAMAGLMLLALSVFTLPALMRLVAPATGSAGGGGGMTGVLAGGAIAAGAIATGGIGGGAALASGAGATASRAAGGAGGGEMAGGAGHGALNSAGSPGSGGASGAAPAAAGAGADAGAGPAASGAPGAGAGAVPSGSGEQAARGGAGRPQPVGAGQGPSSASSGASGASGGRGGGYSGMALGQQLGGGLRGVERTVEEAADGSKDGRR